MAAKTATAEARKKSAETPKVADGFAKSLSSVARHFGVSYSTAAHAWTARGMPKRTAKGYDLKAIEQWRARELTRHTNGRPKQTSAIQQKQAADAELKRLQVKKLQHELSIRQGDYVARREVQRFFAALLTRFRDDIGRIPAEMAASFPADIRAELESQLKDRLDLCLKAIYRQRGKIEELSRADAKLSKKVTS